MADHLPHFGLDYMRTNLGQIKAYCLTFVQHLSNHQIPWSRGRYKMNMCLDKLRTNLGLMSQYCPLFVQLQGDQVKNGKMIKSLLCPVFVLTIFHGLRGPNEDKIGTFFRPMRTKTSPDQDKTENWKTGSRQKWDRGQKWDKCETKVGQKWDKIRTMDKSETKVSSCNCQPAPKGDFPR